MYDIGRRGYDGCALATNYLHSHIHAIQRCITVCSFALSDKFVVCAYLYYIIHTRQTAKWQTYYPISIHKIINSPYRPSPLYFNTTSPPSSSPFSIYPLPSSKIKKSCPQFVALKIVNPLPTGLKTLKIRYSSSPIR